MSNSNKIEKSILTAIIFFISFYIISGYAYIAKYGSEFKPTVGGLWPKPQFEQRCLYRLLDPKYFEFVIVGKTCDILDGAIIRYTKIIKESLQSFDTQEELFESDLVSKIIINLTMTCEQYPHLEMDESYKITGADYISANSIWGILRALETYSQAITLTLNGMLNIQHIKIIDVPRFPHRGLMLDTARHYIKISTILTILDGMSYNKLNVFHWHIVDDQSFPYQSTAFPELSLKGAYMPSMIYTIENILKIVEYARMRGIRVIAEFHVPDHTKSWGKSHPELLTECEWLKKGTLGPMNPIKATTYEFLNKFYSEAVNVFRDKYIHIGCDDVDITCWETNELLDDYIALNSLSSNDLYNFFVNRVSLLLAEHSVSPIVWFSEMLDIYELRNETIVQVQSEDWKKHFKVLTKLRHYVLLSECWSFNELIKNNKNNWETGYNCDPSNFDGSDEQKNYVLGGEACIWTHVIGNHNVIQSIFPKICAMAERLWSHQNITNLTDAAQRLEEHTCRMISRGIPAESPSGTTICV